MDTKYKAELVVRAIGTREEIARVGVSQLDQGYVEKVMLGMLINMSPEYYIDDSEVDAAREREEQDGTTTNQ